MLGPYWETPLMPWCFFFSGHENFWRFFDPGYAMVKIWRRKTTLKIFKCYAKVKTFSFVGQEWPPCLWRFSCKICNHFIWKALRQENCEHVMEKEQQQGIWVWLDTPTPFQGLQLCSPTPNEVEGLNSVTLEFLRLTFMGLLNRSGCGPQGVWTEEYFMPSDTISWLSMIYCHFLKCNCFQGPSWESQGKMSQH